MRNAFEKLLEKKIPELNILTAVGADVRPGSVLESLEKDNIIGYLPKYLGGSVIDKNSLEVNEVPYDIHLDKLSGITSADGALDIMKSVGLKFDSKRSYKIDLEIKGISSLTFANDISKIDFEIAIHKFAKENKDVFKRFKNHFLVIRVLYANEFKISVETEKNGKFEAETSLKDIEFNGNANVKKEGNAILVSNNKEIPFGVVCYKIKRGKLKEKD